eukprot:362942-Chlamydomonas_euryale.AAC.9
MQRQPRDCLGAWRPRKAGGGCGARGWDVGGAWAMCGRVVARMWHMWATCAHQGRHVAGAWATRAHRGRQRTYMPFAPL